MTDVVIVGGGVIGLAIGWRTAAAGRDVVVCDPRPGRGASWAAAGMLAPVTEVHYGEEALLGLNLASAGRWPAFAAELQEVTGSDVGRRTTGTTAVAFDADDAAVLDELASFLAELDLPAEPLDARALRTREPALHPRVRGGLHVAGDHQVDSRRLVTVLADACHRAGVKVLEEPVAHLDTHAGRTRGVTLAGGASIGAETVVLAAGCWSPRIEGVPEPAVPPVRPVKGQVLRLRDARTPPLLGGTVRGLARGRPVYVVPRVDGEVVVGATVEEQGFDVTVTAGATLELLRAATDLVPGVAELELVEAHAGLRPGSPDNAPILGPTEVPGLVLATGHFRNGILLAPVTADAISALLVDGALPAVAAPFQIGRFSR